MLKKLLLLLLLLVLLPSVTNADDPPISLQVTPAFQYAPGKISYKIKIPPNTDNFWFCVGYISNDAPVRERKSCQQLNGIYSPSVFWFEYKNLYVGEYLAIAEVFRVPNRLALRITSPFLVMSSQ